MTGACVPPLPTRVATSTAPVRGWVVGPLLVLSGQFLAIQVLLTDYGDGRQGAAGFRFIVGCLQLSVVHVRRSRAARGVVVVLALAGAVVHGPGAFSDADAAALAHLGQAAPLLTDPVRRHVGATR